MVGRAASAVSPFYFILLGIDPSLMRQIMCATLGGEQNKESRGKQFIKGGGGRDMKILNTCFTQWLVKFFKDSVLPFHRLWEHYKFVYNAPISRSKFITMVNISLNNVS